LKIDEATETERERERERERGGGDTWKLIRLAMESAYLWTSSTLRDRGFSSRFAR